MRLIATAVVLCLVLSPVAYAGEMSVSKSGVEAFWQELWQAVVDLPQRLIEKTVKNTSTAEDNTDPNPVEPPQTEAGPMIIIHG